MKAIILLILTALASRIATGSVTVFTFCFFFSAAGPGYVAKLATDLHLLGTLERDKNDELKGVKALKRDLTPRLVKDVEKATSEE